MNNYSCNNKNIIKLNRKTKSPQKHFPTFYPKQWRLCCVALPASSLLQTPSPNPHPTVRSTPQKITCSRYCNGLNRIQLNVKCGRGKYVEDMAKCGGFYYSGKIATLSYKVERFVSSLGNTFNGSSEMCQILPNLCCQENKQVGIPTMAFLISNPLMLSTPFKALAETSEADNSVFNMNMPLLLSVALKGKTVGALRRQAKIESYAPSLSYAPVGGRRPETEEIVVPKKQGLIY
ncbi:hypothetical protein SO802_004893 [Lithocarpus litseifolius]|uniref:Uncharacterized protein n=1 Tax=Lithocarpus litseifolius TaxID=425828 RepID=A0AAW2DKC9_9ROSI